MSQTARQGLLEKEGEARSLVGTRQERYDGDLKVSGSAVFGSDVSLPNMLFGKILRSTFTHAKIVSIDSSRAAQIPGVKAVITAADLPHITVGFAVKDQTVFAQEKAVYYGQPICAVAAETLDIAERAMKEIDVEFDSLPNVLTIDEALKDDSYPIHPGVVPAGAPPYASKNVCAYTKIHRGNVERAFKAADFVVEENYETQQVHQAYLEPRAATAEVDQKSGRIKIWAATQSPFLTRNSLAELLEVPVSQIQVLVTHTGGGFGSKISAYLEPICVALARKSGRPVRIVLTREEEFLAGTPRPAMRFWIKSGVKDGKIVARVGKAIVDTGAFGSEGAVYSNIATFALLGPYDIPNFETEGISVYTNKQQAGAYRAPGTMETAFATESHTDMLARKAGIDPIDFRLKNAWDEGSLGPTGQTMKGVGLKDALRKLREAVDWDDLKASRRDGGRFAKGVGVACGLIPSVGIHASAAYIKLNEDGKIVLVTGAQDTGSGSITGLVMITAEVLGVEVRDVILRNADTDFIPWDGGAQGSRTTFGAGTAVLRAARDAREQIITVAAGALKTDRENVVLRGGAAYVRGTENNIKFGDLSMRANYVTGGPILGRGSFVMDFPEYDRSSLDGYAFVPSLHDPTYVAHAAVVEVDRSTGKVKVIRYVAAQDVGHAINPLGVQGQIQGGTVQGLGYALYEEMKHDEGGLTTTTNFGDYKIPTIMDVPLIEPLIVEGHYGSGPYGAKGVGEASIVPPAPAIANAIFDASGARVRRLPLRPERVLNGIDEADS